MKEKIHLIWDWNGTLLDDVSANMRTVDEMLTRRGLETVDDLEKYRRLFGFPISDFYLKVGFDLEKEAFDKVAEEYVAAYVENSRDVSLYPDVRETLEAFCRAGVEMSILSATEHTRLLTHVASYGIEEYFSQIVGVSDNRGDSKAGAGARYIKSLGGVRAVFIGDTVHDASVARECGGECVLVSRGHMDSVRLKETGCPVFSDLGEVFRYIMK